MFRGTHLGLSTGILVFLRRGFSSRQLTPLWPSARAAAPAKPDTDVAFGDHAIIGTSENCWMSTCYVITVWLEVVSIGN